MTSEVVLSTCKTKEFKVNKITYTVSGIKPNTVTFTNGALKVSSAGTTLATASSMSLTNSAETELTANTAGFNELTAKLLDNSRR